MVIDTQTRVLKKDGTPLPNVFAGGGAARGLSGPYDPELDKGHPAGRPARVAVTMKDGTVDRADASISRRDVANPLTTEERREKAVALFDAGLGTGKASVILAAIENLAGTGSLKDLGTALRSSF
ncbi:hypothetical protein [Microvirga brassicacearum]|uniref:MmgE/PrpD family protein n=1 Tax=Microvirga brassicacearum TaxID=2580413 RepID=A0A5N3PDN4_9HYPH|nr:hypothetical protein [Microvirga brassicacearum]KAB0267839.1 hypothetical protein FEZ63_07440 [Microvirga brassicacearum]